MFKRITADLLTYLPAKMLPALTAFITVPIFTHLFTPDQYGNYMLAVGVAEFLLAATTTGLAAGAVRFYAAYSIKQDLPRYFTSLYANTGAITLITALIGAAVLLLGRALFPEEVYPLLWVALLVFIANGWYVILSNVLRAQERSRWFTAFELFYKYGTVIFSVGLILLLGMGVEGMLWGQMLALAIPILPLVWLTTRGTGMRSSVRREGFSLADARQMWAYALPLTLGNVAFWALRLADRYIIEANQGSYEVGLYSVSYNISTRSIDMLVGLFLLVPGPIIMRLWEERGRQAAEEAMTAITRMFLLLVIPAVVGLAVTAGPLVRLLAEDAYLDGYRAIWLVATASAAFGLGQLGSFGTLLAKRTGIIARNQFLATGVSLALNFLLIPHYGFMGAAVSACVAFVLMATLQALSSRRFFTWRWPLRTLTRVLIASALMALAVMGLLVALGPTETTWAQVGAVLAAVAVGGLVYGVALAALGEVSLRKVKQAIFSRGEKPAETEVAEAPIAPGR